MTSMTDVQLKELAIFIAEGEVFSSMSLPEEDIELLPMIFLPLSLFSEEQMKEMEKDDPVFFYEHLSEKLPKSIKGYPIFKSVRYVSKEEYSRFSPMYDAYLVLKKNFLV